MVARCTTLVSFEAGSSFSMHSHGGGEEFLVLDGDFCDQLTGKCQAGTYVRHPIGSSHQPWSEAGGTILVKLRQMSQSSAALEQEHTVVDSSAWRIQNPGFGDDGCARLPLFSAESSTEAVAMEWWEGGSSHDLSPTELGGIEIFIVSGVVEFRSEQYCAWSWIRLPPGGSWGVEGTDDPVSPAHFKSLTDEVVVWMKSGHLGMNAVL